MALKENKQTLLYTILGSIIFILTGCGMLNNNENTILETPYEETEFLMGTYVSLQVYDEGKEHVLDEAFTRAEELADQITVNEAGSEMAAINDAAGDSAVEVSADVFPLLETAYEYSAIPDGGFDMTIGPITDLWRIGFDDARVPEPSEIEEVLPLVDYQFVELDSQNNSIFLTESGMQLDLGAIAKGYIADEIARVFEENDVTTAIMDLGGNVVVMGDSPTREEGGFNVGIQDPFSERGSYVGALNLSDQSVVTSGIYERYLEEDGEIYHHLMNPDTGYPFDNNLASATIITEDSIDADSLSTVVFGFGLEEGLDYVNTIEDTEAIFITRDYEIYTSEGLTNNFSLTNDSYEWINQ